MGNITSFFPKKQTSRPPPNHLFCFCGPSPLSSKPRGPLFTPFSFDFLSKKVAPFRQKKSFAPLSKSLEKKVWLIFPVLINFQINPPAFKNREIPPNTKKTQAPQKKKLGPPKTTLNSSFSPKSKRGQKKNNM